MTLHDRYLTYQSAMIAIGITPLSEAIWLRAITHAPAPKLSDEQFDRDTERRDGWSME